MTIIAEKTGRWELLQLHGIILYYIYYPVFFYITERQKIYVGDTALLHCATLYYTVLHNITHRCRTVLTFTKQYYTTLHSTAAWFYTLLNRTTLHWTSG